ncbi:MAG: GNAT family N-acetyltransferase [Armatimonadota bacterium]|nr:GNAT family N-acetyltransferase [Armatimonadota bacterium]
MLVALRPATAADATALAAFLEVAYPSGYLPTFDRDGPPAPQDVWFVHAEKDVCVVEVDRQPAGLLIVGRTRGQWLAEELLAPTFAEMPPSRRERLVARLAALLVARFQAGRQDTVLLRAAEDNAVGLAVAQALQAGFANALLVYRYRGPRRPAVAPPAGYQVRRASPEDRQRVVRLCAELFDDRAQAATVDRALAAREGRAFVAERDGMVVGVAAVDVGAGRAAWTVGVRETHRRRGVGRALAASVLSALAARGVVPYATAWALDPVAGAFLRRLGFGLERAFLYLERPL